MDKRSKDLLRALVKELRHIFTGTIFENGTILRGDLDRELERIGIPPNGVIMPLDMLTDTHNGALRTYRIAAAQLQPVPLGQRAAVRAEIVERAAYTWINRLLALRAMETRRLINDTLRVEGDYGEISEKLFILRQQEPVRAAGDDGGWWAVLEDSCNEQAQALPGLFTLEDPAAALRPGTAALLQAIDLVNGTKLPGFTPDESDAAFRDPDAIGWAYQFYQEEAKQQIDAKCKRGGKVVNRAEIAAKTQLFTEPYMVQWLLQNSLGRSYAEAYLDSTLPTNWPYYVKPEQIDADSPVELADLTLLDPCMGSGHFLRAAFDMLVAMYREQHPDFSAMDIADTILITHLHGIDIDPRAAQLAALTLYLRAWELVRNEERKANYMPPPMNLATTPTNLNAANLLRHLEREPRDEALKPLLEGIFTALEQADILGGLLRPSEYIEEAIKKLKKDHTLEIDFNLDAAELHRTILEISKHSPAELKDILFTTLRESFKREAGRTDDVSAMLFGREAEEGVRLLQLLDRRYAVIVTNPPYLGSKYMDTPIKKYIEKYYATSKRDLSAAFILRSLELCKTNGCIAMVTQQSWMFLRSYEDLRAISAEKLEKLQNKDQFTGVLRETSIEMLAHLGEFAFEDTSAAGAFVAMFILTNRKPCKEHVLMAFRLVGMKSLLEKAEALKNRLASAIFTVRQSDLIDIPESPLVYWVRMRILDILKSPRRINRGDDKVAGVHVGLCTGHNDRFIRFTWEINYDLSRWPYCARAGHYQKWSGLNYSHAAWRIGAIEYAETGGSAVRNTHKFFQNGVTYGRISRGAIGCRLFWGDELFEQASIAIIPTKDITPAGFLALLNNRVVSYLLRVMTQGIEFNAGYVENLPYERPSKIACQAAERCVCLKKFLVSSDLLERSFDVNQYHIISCEEMYQVVSLLLHTYEGFIEENATMIYRLAILDITSILAETGIPAGWYPLVVNYDALPAIPEDIQLPPLPQELYDYLAKHERIHPEQKELARIKANLRGLYKAGPKAKNVGLQESDEVAENDNRDEVELIMAGAYIPIPTETFLEELSIKMELHPISVYWLLAELRVGGVRCISEELRILEDRLSVIILRLLGHRWPTQIEANEPVPAWAVQDGIIPLVAGSGSPTLATRVRERLRAEDGDAGVPRAEQLLYELTGLTLEEWLRKQFFSHHVSQFKHRPIAWHLASTPRKPPRSGRTNKRGSRASRSPAFECFLFYHACTRDVLARIRTQYVEPIIQAEHNQAGPSQLFGEDTATVIASERILELEAFADQLRQIEEQGFICNELTAFIVQEPEPLDRWCGNGYIPSRGRDEFLRQEAAWYVDTNDGVRVNIAPLQLASVLVSDVLKTSDASQALVDRARWRADERRWVREGKLPRCGWMGNDVPESPRWHALHKQEDARQEESISQDTLLLDTVDIE